MAKFIHVKYFFKSATRPRGRWADCAGGIGAGGRVDLSGGIEFATANGWRDCAQGRRADERLGREQFGGA